MKQIWMATAAAALMLASAGTPAAAARPDASKASASKASVSQAEADKARADILAVVAAMEQAWNRGDFRGYMAGFENPGVRFVSNGRVSSGWQESLDNYIRGYGGPPERRGQLHFYDMKIEVYSPDAALLIGHFHNERPEHPLEGINTRLFRKVDGRWVINMNHVSSFEAHAGEPGTEGVPRLPRTTTSTATPAAGPASAPASPTAKQ
ncbi:nuclear transport factor 2 family protein [Sphingobium aquiterrae]|uniref:YybH family protein n=1 Tax=Sphingobium aquiterrae TaxID=2038656 RepID=UPI003016C8CA